MKYIVTATYTFLVKADSESEAQMIADSSINYSVIHAQTKDTIFPEWEVEEAERSNEPKQ